VTGWKVEVPVLKNEDHSQVRKKSEKDNARYGWRPETKSRSSKNHPVEGSRAVKIKQGFVTKADDENDSPP